LRQTVADSTETVVRNATSFLDKLEANFHQILDACVCNKFRTRMFRSVYQASPDYRHGYRTGKKLAAVGPCITNGN
jgi:hypothetical protein